MADDRPLLRIDHPDEAPGVAVLTLDRPDKRNALSVALRDQVSDALDALASDESTSVVVITGAGATFSAGFDLREFDRAATDAAFGEQLWASSDRYHHAVAAFPLPTIAAINGPAIAGGFDLAVLCDLRLIADGAHVSHPERTFGPVVYGPLRELVGGGVARELLLTGRSVSADEAVRIGLASSRHPAEDLLAAALETARQITATPRDLLRQHKAKILRFAGIDGETPTLDL
jgi:enoyl-CoA hydratase